ncbi:HDL426Wp [Eremothecium sinecaudum]|uniref:ATP-dependent 6-phosphofructokinase n=1 Tax=Eremothecium sinecaudum TaxID=45286 RepID=A0A0X8HRZ5_9SACH|nr:HDL426Wp [Eremothecium sinecaudum]AMD20318.1 HDL426Wp [Eremothecium sinecaudum]
MSVETVYGYGFRSLRTTDESLYASTVKFYRGLGFTVVKIYDKFKNPEDSILSLGTSHSSRKETWLESFKLSAIDADGFRVPQQEASNSNQSDGAMVKIRLVQEGIKGMDDAVDIKYYSADFEKFACDFPDREQVSKNTFKIIDPLGNNIFITSMPYLCNEKEVDAKFFTENVPQPWYEDEEEVTGDADDISLLKKSLHSAAKASEGKPKKKIAVMTSGGDSPGMNVAVRAVVRAGIYYGCDVYTVYEGYEGLLRGGDMLHKMGWADVRGWLSEGGTLIGTARCLAFKERVGMKKAAANLIEKGIDALIVCGGDGSLTGADLFRSLWPGLVEELVSEGRFTPAQVAQYRSLTIVGLVGSIDNDMSGTDSTIGAYSALERICEMVDYIHATAKSHSRAFIVEVMGRHCGWLALMAGIATAADYIFIPERAAEPDKWREDLKSVCKRHKNKGRRNITVIVAEGALDKDLKPITSEEVKDTLVEMGLDTRITTLGHVQRGGTAVAHDRWLATLQGVDAVKAVLEMTPDTPSPLIGILENKIIRMPLMESVKLTKEVATAIEAKDFDKAISLRDTEFIELYDNFISTTIKDDGSEFVPENERLRIGIVHVGAPSAALNAATRAASLYCLSHGHKPFAIMNGFSGLIQDGVVNELSWIDVENWHNLGGSEIGTNRSVAADDMGAVAYHFQKNQFDGLIIVGGFEGFKSLKQLHDARPQYPIFNIPMTLIPATVSNNVPGTEYSLGTDTCLNSLVNYTDAIKQSASATRRRVFVVEVQGGHSGYVASFTGLVTGAVSVYTPEQKIDLGTIKEDLALLQENFRHDQGENRNGKILIRNEQASSIYTTELIADIISESSKGRFGVRTAIPGHVQQGGVPSSKDRVAASRFAVKCVKFIESWNNKNTGDRSKDDKILRFKYVNGVKNYTVENESASAAVICVNGSTVSFKPIKDLWTRETNVELRKGHEIHWKEFNRIGDILSGRCNLRKEVSAKKLDSA